MRISRLLNCRLTTTSIKFIKSFTSLISFWSLPIKININISISKSLPSLTYSSNLNLSIRSFFRKKAWKVSSVNWLISRFPVFRISLLRIFKWNFYRKLLKKREINLKEQKIVKLTLEQRMVNIKEVVVRIIHHSFQTITS